MDDAGIAQHWNKYYDTGADFTHSTQSELSKLLGYVDNKVSKNCLDIGCGTGQLSRELFHRGFSVLGIDVSDKAIEIARRASIYIGKGLEYGCIDFEQETLAGDQTFSLITCKFVYSFIKDNTAFLQKVFDYLHPGGVFIIITPTKEQVPPEKVKITVDYQDTLNELGQYFKVETLESRGLTYFICRQQSVE